MGQKVSSFTLKNSIVVIALIIVASLFTDLLGHWATYPTARHQAVVQEQKDFLKRNGLFTGAQEFNDLNNTPEAQHIRKAGSIVAVVQYTFYIVMLVIAYHYIRQRREKAVVMTATIVSMGSLIATAIIVILSGNLSNISLEFQSTLLALVGTVTLFFLVTLGIVALIQPIHDKLKKAKKPVVDAKSKLTHETSNDTAKQNVHKLQQIRGALPAAIFAVAGLSAMLAGFNMADLRALNPDGTCSQQEYDRLRGDCTLSKSIPGSAAATQSSRVTVQTTLAIKASSADKPEGNSGTTPFTFVVTRSGNLSSISAVNWSVPTGSRLSPKSGTVNFSYGESSKPVIVSVAGNSTFEPDEFFSVCLGVATNAGILQNNSCANGVIRNDDSGSPCGYAAGVAVTAACAVAATNRGINTPVTTTLRGVVAVANQISNGVSRIIQPSLPNKVLVTMGDSYEVGIPRACSNLQNCVSQVSTLLGPGVLASILKTSVFGSCFRQDYTSTDLTLAALNQKKDVSWSANNVACGGSKATQMLTGWLWFANPKLPPIPSQLDALKASNIGLVVISAGGNDVLMPEQGEPSIIDCMGELYCDKSSEIYKISYQKLEQLYNRKSQSGNLVNFYEAIRKKTSAPILVEGYPVWFGDKQYVTVKSLRNTRQCQRYQRSQSQPPNECIVESNRYVKEAAGCETLENVERSLGREIGQELNGRISEAVKYVNDKYKKDQFIYIDPFAPGRYDYVKDNACAISSTKPITGPMEFTPFPWHPNVSGVQRRSQQVLETYRNYQNKNNPLTILTQ